MNEGLRKAQEVQRKMRAAGVKIRPKDPITKHEENPKSLRLAINAMCWDCVGAGADTGPKKEIGNCPIERCPLWTVRPYQEKR